MAEDVLYEEVDGIAIVAINRPEKKNTLTESVVRGIADGIDAATRSKEVAAVVLRGVGVTAGYVGEWDVPYGAPDIETREGAWDPVEDLAFMGVRASSDLGVSEAGAGRGAGRWEERPWCCAATYGERVHRRPEASTAPRRRCSIGRCNRPR